MARTGVIFSHAAVAQLSRSVRKTRRVKITQSPPPQRYRGSNGERRRVAIIGGLDGPADFDTAPTTCVAAILERDLTTGKLVDSGRRITITNFDPEVTAIADGTYGKAEFLGGVWELYYAGCTAAAEFEGLSEESSEEESPPPP